jgi:hypothetical protein
MLKPIRPGDQQRQRAELVDDRVSEEAAHARPISTKSWWRWRQHLRRPTLELAWCVGQCERVVDGPGNSRSHRSQRPAGAILSWRGRGPARRALNMLFGEGEGAGFEAHAPR